MSCGCYCFRKPRYKRLVDALYPADPQDTTPVASNLDKLLYFSNSSPEHLDRVGDYLTLRLKRSLNRDRRGHVCVSLKIMEKLLSECDAQRLQLITDSYLQMLHAMLESTSADFQIMATDSFVMFSEREEQTTPYHRQYDFFIHRFASMALVKKVESLQIFQQTRKAGLRGLCGVIKKTEGDESLQLNIWEPADMNKIVPPFLFNLQDTAGISPSHQLDPDTEQRLERHAEDGLKALVASAGLTHIDSVISPVLQHFDLNNLWTQRDNFAANVFLMIIRAVQKQHRYKVIQALVEHLDKKAKQPCSLKQGILDTLSQCVTVASDSSLGPSVLDVFCTLVRHLCISIENNDSSPEASINSAFQDSLTQTMGKFAGVLPDYHKPDIITLITSYMEPTQATGKEKGAGESAANKKQTGTGSPVLTASLVKCIRRVADTYHPEVLETTFPESLFGSLVNLLRITDHKTQLDVCLLWHQLIDHHGNKPNLPLHTKWESLESCGLTLGRVSKHFLSQTKSSLYPSLYALGLCVSTDRNNLLAFYQLLALLALEFSQPGLLDMVHFLSKLQDAAQDSSIVPSAQRRAGLHAIVAGVLYFLSKVSSTSALSEHVVEVVERRRAVAASLLPDTLFGSEAEGADGVSTEKMAESSPAGFADNLMFELRERGLDRQSPEPAESRRAAYLVREYSSSSNDFLPHASLSLDYGGDHQVSTEQINFNSFKEETAFEETPATVFRDRLGSSLTYEQQVGLSSRNDPGLGEIAHLLGSTSLSSTQNSASEQGHHRTASAYDIELPSL